MAQDTSTFNDPGALDAINALLDIALKRIRKLESREIPWTALGFHSIAGGEGPYNANGDIYRALVSSNTRIYKFYVRAYVATTNDATNFWTIQLNNSTGGNITSILTSSSAPNTWLALETDVFVTRQLVSSTSLFVVVNIQKTGAPGDITFIPWVTTQ